MTPPVVSFVGKSGSGKTTFLIKVVEELVKRGYNIGTIKHDAHSFDIDHKGKDSYRHKKAGATVVALSSPEKFAIIKDVKEEWRPERLISLFLNDCDCVITEGYKTGPFPKIEVLRKAHSTTPVSLDDDRLLAFVTDLDMNDWERPQFKLNDYKKVASFIEKEIIEGHKDKGVSLVVDGKVVELKPFIENLLKDGVTGMIRTLKGCSKAKEIEIRIKRS